MTEQELRQQIETNPASVNWPYISQFHTLSEDFIREFKDSVDWYYISCYQTLSEDFIREFKDSVNWFSISQSQTLSEDFIREFKDSVSWSNISDYQTLTQSFRKEHNLSLPVNNWLYASKAKKKEAIKQSGLYQIIGNDIIAYKGIKKNWESKYKRGFVYELGGTFRSKADHNLSNENSFGLSAWTLEKAKEYCSEKIVKVRIPIAALAAIVHDGGKLRATEMTIVEEISLDSL